MQIIRRKNYATAAQPHSRTAAKTQTMPPKLLLGKGPVLKLIPDRPNQLSIWAAGHDLLSLVDSRKSARV